MSASICGLSSTPPDLLDAGHGGCCIGAAAYRPRCSPDGSAAKIIADLIGESRG